MLGGNELIRVRASRVANRHRFPAPDQFRAALPEPLPAAKRVVQVRGVDLSDIFGIATMSPKFKPAPAVKGIRRDDQPIRGLSPATRGRWGNINHVRQPDA